MNADVELPSALRRVRAVKYFIKILYLMKIMEKKIRKSSCFIKQNNGGNAPY